MEKAKKDPFIVSDQTCRGCFYYSYLSGGSGTRCCDYTYMTGKFKPQGETCAECSVKKLSRRKRNAYSLRGGANKRRNKR